MAGIVRPFCRAAALHSPLVCRRVPNTCSPARPLLRAFRAPVTSLPPLVSRSNRAIHSATPREAHWRAASATPQGGEASGGPRERNVVAAGAEAGEGPRLVIYSRDGCCLCDGLKEKIETALMMGTESNVLDGLQVEVRDITTRKEWMEAYQYEIPVMTHVHVDQSGNSTETPIPRQSPRASVDRLRKALEAAFSS